MDIILGRAVVRAEKRSVCNGGYGFDCLSSAGTSIASVQMSKVMSKRNSKRVGRLYHAPKKFSNWLFTTQKVCTLAYVKVLYWIKPGIKSH